MSFDMPVYFFLIHCPKVDLQQLQPRKLHHGTPNKSIDLDSVLLDNCMHNQNVFAWSGIVSIVYKFHSVF